MAAPEALAADSRADRFWIAAGGPCADLILGGACGWFLVAFRPQEVMPTTLTLVTLVHLVMELCPVVRSDGSRMLESLLGDDLSQRSALSTVMRPLYHDENGRPLPHRMRHVSGRRSGDQYRDSAFQVNANTARRQGVVATDSDPVPNQFRRESSRPAVNAPVHAGKRARTPRKAPPESG